MKETPEVNNAHWLAENDFAIDVHKEKVKEQLYDMFFKNQYKEKYWECLSEATFDEDLISMALLEERRNHINALSADRSRRLDYLL